MTKSIRDFFSPLFTQLNFLALILCSALAAAAGPFGTYETQSMPSRLVYWFLVCGISILIGHTCRHWAIRLAAGRGPVWIDLLVVALMMVFFTPVLWLLTHGILTFESGAGPSMVKLSYYVFAVTVGVCVARRILPGFEPVGYFGAKPVEMVENPRLLRRLPADFAGPILRLTVRDHFVDVVAASGTETIRMRFADAIDEMDTVIGHCTHRSHWVAEHAIVGSERGKGKIFLKLTNGDLVPVSRKYRPGLETAGVI